MTRRSRLKFEPAVMRDLLARVGVGVLFLLLSINIFEDFRKTHHITGLLLLVSEGLVVVYTIIRRRTDIVDRSAVAGALTAVSLIGPPLLRANDAPGLLPDAVTALGLVAGLILVIAGKLTLGRSFGLVPANRGVVVAGPYLIVRHPIYTGYLITHLAFLVAHPQWTNIAIAVVADAALIARALVEERVLGRDERYRDYCARVSWHLMPGVF